MSINQLILPNSLSQSISCAGLQIKNTSVAGYQPSTLSFYEELDISATSSGCLARLCNFSFMRIGRHVILSFEGFNDAPQLCTGNGSLNFPLLIPRRFWSDGFDEAVIRVNFNGSETTGLAQANPNGNFQIFASVSAGSWTAGQLIGVQGFSMSWTVP